MRRWQSRHCSRWLRVCLLLLSLLLLSQVRHLLGELRLKFDKKRVRVRVRAMPRCCTNSALFPLQNIPLRGHVLHGNEQSKPKEDKCTNYDQLRSVSGFTRTKCPSKTMSLQNKAIHHGSHVVQELLICTGLKTCVVGLNLQVVKSFKIAHLLVIIPVFLTFYKQNCHYFLAF